MELRLATPEECRARDRLTHEAWGSPLSVEEFCDREERLRATPWSRASLRSWLLARGSEVLASCETYRMESRIGAQRGWTFGIASVFVERALRGRGYAQKLLRQVGELLAAEGAQASILYSEVGPALYARLGWVARPAATRAWGARAGEGLPAERVDEAEVATLLAAADGRPLRYRVTMTLAQVDWHWERARIYRARLERPKRFAPGLRAGGAWAILYPDYRTHRLTLLELQPGTREETAAVVEGARREAASLGLREVTIQENPYNVEHLPEGGQRACDDGVPMIRVFEPQITSEEWRDFIRGVWV